jgi:hypothetical protein
MSIALRTEVRFCRPGGVMALGGFVLATAACGLLGPAEYAPRDEYADYDDPPPLDTRTVVQAPAPPPSAVHTISESEWNDRFEQAQRAKHDRALELNDAVARCYQKLRDPQTGGSATLAQAICFGGNAPKTSPAARANLQPAHSEGRAGTAR